MCSLGWMVTIHESIASLCALYGVLVFEALPTYVDQVAVPSLIALFGAATTVMIKRRGVPKIAVVSLDPANDALPKITVVNLDGGDDALPVPVDPLECQISQDIANIVVAWLANTLGAAEYVWNCLNTIVFRRPMYSR
ncbi:hypothetical protein D8674_032672 [Pyrus ussuriensis x Pyrus communis]|uniref:Uncharacterized protein n=1 Tax=Pyrus ussuriensis x Pyrus communis TaxID=2448454 RepID=A0A5N5HM34_9ROSA|nr:hypothetical protein D8674_032672 [Pyrus ussuriensis x Pyrus communis]